MSNKENTLSVWIPDDEEKLLRDVKKFKRRFNYENGADKTVSELSRRWIRAGYKVDELLTDRDREVLGDREFADYVRQAVDEKIDREKS